MTQGNKTLHLTLKKQWWNMIESGEKTEEYREIKPYWIKRLCRMASHPMNPKDHNCIYSGCIFNKICKEDESSVIQRHDYVCFHYGRTARIMCFELNFIYIGTGDPKWGAPENEKVFCLVLGNRVA